MRKKEETSKGENSSKKKKIKYYNLGLGRNNTIIPVDSYKNCKEEDLEDYKPTGINLESLIHIPISPNDCSVMEVGYDTEFIGVNKVINKNGKRIHVRDSNSHFNYLVSTQYYINLFEIGEEHEKQQDEIWLLENSISLASSTDEIKNKEGLDKAREKLKQLKNDLNQNLEKKVWSDVILHSPQKWEGESISEEDILNTRLSLGEFLHLIIQDGFNKGMIKYIPKNIHLISHNNTSDIDKFRDIHKGVVEGERRLLDFFSTIRKSYSHRNTHISCKVDNDKQPDKVVNIRIYDTINLVSAVKKSLDELSKSVDEKYPNQNLRKIKLPEGVIGDMLKYRKNDFKGFCEYGLQDAKIPVFYSEVIRNIVLEILGDKSKKSWSKSRILFERFKLPLTTTSIGARFLKDKVWQNTGFEYYDREVVEKINNDYGHSFQRDNENRSKLAWLNILGYHTKKFTTYKEKTDSDGKSHFVVNDKPQLKDVPFTPVEDMMPIIKKTYYGGRNEQFFYGISTYNKNKPIYDYDLVSAYPTAMLQVGRIDWRNEVNLLGKSKEEIFSIVENFDEYASYFHIKSFKFPDHVKYPTIPVKNLKEDGIIFPLEGGKIDDKSGREGTYINGVEIYVARQLGCEIELGRGVVFRMDKSFLPYEKFIQTTLKRRRDAEEKDDQVLVKFWKELMNSLYGKTAQGISQKRVFDIAENASSPLTESPITSYPIVSIVTAIVRGVLGLMMNNIGNLKEGYFIGNITTDGFATDFPNDEKLWKKICDNKLIKNWIDARNKMETHDVVDILQHHPKQKNIIEEKHKVYQYIGWRTRGQATLKMGIDCGSNQEVLENDELDKDEEVDILIDIPTFHQIKDLKVKEEMSEGVMKAKAGQKTPSKDNINQNLQMVWWFLNRFYGLKYSVDYIRGIRDMVNNQNDATNILGLRKVSMDFDWKRMPDLKSLKSMEVEFVDILQNMKLCWDVDSKDNTKYIPYFTAEFKDVNKMDVEEIENRKKKIQFPTFFTKPLKDLNEFEDLKEKWATHLVDNGVNNSLIDDGFSSLNKVDLNIPYDIWNEINYLFNTTPFKQHSELSSKFDYEIKDMFGNEFHLNSPEYLKLFSHYLSNKTLMTSVENIKYFFQLKDGGIFDKTIKGESRNKRKVGDNIDLKESIVTTLILFYKLQVNGCEEKYVGKKAIQFALDIWKRFYSPEEIITKFKKGSKFEINEEIYLKLKPDIERRMNVAFNSFKKSDGVEFRRVKKQKFVYNEENFTILTQLKHDYPTIDVELFLGSKRFSDYVKPVNSDIPDEEVKEEMNVFEVISNSFKQERIKREKMIMKMTAQEKMEFEEMEKMSN